MANENTALRFNFSHKSSDVFDYSKLYEQKDNADFISKVVKEINKLDESKLGLKITEHSRNGLRAAIGLTGEYGLIGYAARQAQSIIRFDKQASWWSHSFLFYDEVPDNSEILRKRIAKSPMIWESSIDFSGPAKHHQLINGVNSRFLNDYINTKFDFFNMHTVPNIAVVVIALSEKEVDLILKRATNPNADALNYDFSGLIGTWLSYIFKKQSDPNPLSAGSALYCSAYCQMAYEAVSIDLAAGAHAKNTSPEHIWQAGKWFSNIYKNLGFPIRVYYCIRDPYCVMFPVKNAPTSSLVELSKELRR